METICWFPVRFVKFCSVGVQLMLAVLLVRRCDVLIWLGGVWWASAATAGQAGAVWDAMWVWWCTMQRICGGMHSSRCTKAPRGVHKVASTITTTTVYIATWC
jgi:hypothetical protein